MPAIDHRELERKSQDTVAVHNSDPKPFVVLGNSFQNVVPASTRDIGPGPGVQHLPRYIAERYLTVKCHETLVRENDEAIAAENEDPTADKQKLRFAVRNCQPSRVTARSTTLG